MSENTQNNQEEVEVGKLFILIANGIKSMFKGIVDFFKLILHYVLLSLIFIKKHAIVLGISALLGGLFGYFTSNHEKLYTSNSILEMNFGSGNLFYSQNDYLNVLIQEKNFKELSEIFNISIDKAKTLKEFRVFPYNKKENLLKEYDYYIQHTDSVYTVDLEFSDFSKRYKNPDYRFQEFTVYGSNPLLFPKLNDGVEKIIDNKYFRNILSSKQSELVNRKKSYNQQLNTIDSLYKNYQKVTLLEANKSTEVTTNINMSNSENSPFVNADLLQQADEIVKQLKIIEEEINHNNFVVSQVSEFKTGKKLGAIFYTKWFRFAFLGFLLAIGVLLAIRLNKYLETYTKPKN